MRKFGASGFVTLSNGDANGPVITPLAADLDGVVSPTSSAQTTVTLRRREHKHLGSAWISHKAFSTLFSRQTTTSAQTPLPSALPAAAPAVLAGAFWTNSSTSKQLTVLGGNFSFAATNLAAAAGVALYDPSAGTLTALNGPQVNGTVRALLVDGNSLYVGGEFTISGASVNGLALYDLSSGAWDPRRAAGAAARVGLDGRRALDQQVHGAADDSECCGLVRSGRCAALPSDLQL